MARPSLAPPTSSWRHVSRRHGRRRGRSVPVRSRRVLGGSGPGGRDGHRQLRQEWGTRRRRSVRSRTCRRRCRARSAWSSGDRRTEPISNDQERSVRRAHTPPRAPCPAPVGGRSPRDTYAWSTAAVARFRAGPPPCRTPPDSSSPASCRRARPRRGVAAGPAVRAGPTWPAPTPRRLHRGQRGLREDIVEDGRRVGRHGEREEQQHRAEPALSCGVTGELRHTGDHGRGRDHHDGAACLLPGMGPRGEQRTTAHAHGHGRPGQCEDPGAPRVGQVVPERGGEGAEHGVDGLLGPPGQHQRHRRQCHGECGVQGARERPVHFVQGERAARGQYARQVGRRTPPSAPGHKEV